MSSALRYTILSFALFALSFFACSGGSETVATRPHAGGSETVGMYGALVDTANTPVPGTVVRIYEPADSSKIIARDTTDSAGRYAIDSADLTPAVYSMAAVYQSGEIILVSFRDSINYQQAGLNLGTDTLRAPGAIRGRIALDGGIDHSGIFCYIPGTSWSATTDSAGAFLMFDIPPGAYSLNCALPGYNTLKRDSIRVNSGDTTLTGADTLRIDPLAPPPTPEGLQAWHNQGARTIALSWRPTPVADLEGYHVYLDSGGFGANRLTSTPLDDTSFIYHLPQSVSDAAASALRFHLTSIDRDGNESLRSPAPAITSALSVILGSSAQVIEYGGSIVCSVAVLNGPDDLQISVDFDSDGNVYEPIVFPAGRAKIDTMISSGNARHWDRVRIYVTGANIMADTGFAVHIRPRPISLSIASVSDTSMKLAWDQSPDSDFAAYLLYKTTQDGIAGIDTINELEQTLYEYRTVNADTQQFRIAVLDSEGVTGVLSEQAAGAIYNSAPAFVQKTVTDTAMAGKTYSRILDAADRNPDELTYALVAEPHAGASIQSRLFSWTPPPGSEPHSWRIVVSDNRGGSDTLRLRVAVMTTDTILNGADLITPRRYHKSATVNGSLYVFGGCADIADPLGAGARQQTLASVERYDSDSRTWNALDKTMQTGRYAMAAAAFGQNIYVFGGLQDPNSPLNTVEKFDPSSGEWEIIDTMPAPVYGSAAASLNNRIYVAGGVVDRQVSGAIHEYNPASGQWRIIAELEMPRAYHSLAVCEQQLVTGGGFGGAAGPDASVSIEVFDPATGESRTEAALENGRMHFSLAVVDNKVYAIGGHDTNMQMPAAVARLKVFGGQWENVRRLPEARQGHCVTALNGKLFITGGAPGIAYPNPGQSNKTFVLYP